MPTPEAWRNLSDLRKLGVTATTEAERAIAAAWADAWASVADDWAAAIEELAALQAADGMLTRDQILRTQRVANAMRATEIAMMQAAEQSGIITMGHLERITQAAYELTELLIQSQLPPEMRSGDLIWTRADEQAIERIIDRSRGEIVSRTQPLPAATMQAVRSELIRGVAVGENPRRVAARIHQATGMSRHRAETIARTEMLDAMRGAERQRRIQNPVVIGWMWIAALDARTCPSCAGMHGKVFPPEEPGPNDHPNGRCVAMPTTPSWADLGFPDIPDPDIPIESAEEWFWSLPEADQVAMMGPRRHQMLTDGDITWGDLATRRTNPGWRDSWAATSVTDLEALANAG